MIIRNTFFILLFVAAKSHAGWFDDSETYLESCINLYKEKHNIELYVKATEVKKIKSYKYEYTPVIVARGKETVLVRQYCEYYPEEKMVYTGLAESVIEERQQEEVKRAKRKLILKQKEEDRKAIEKKNQAELNTLREKAKEVAEEKARQAELELERIKAAERVAKEKERNRKEIEKQKMLAEFTPLLPLCIKNDYPRLKNKLNTDSPNFDGNLIPKELRPLSFNIAGEYIIVKYSYYSYDKKKHDRWKQQNGPTAGRLFKNKSEATCLISKLKV